MPAASRASIDLPKALLILRSSLQILGVAR
jgi:hypothetical protein